MIGGLPRDSHYVEAVHPEARWDERVELLARIAEMQDEQNRLQDEANRIAYSVATGGKRRLREALRAGQPLHIPRPGETKPERRKATAHEIARFFGARRPK